MVLFDCRFNFTIKRKIYEQPYRFFCWIAFVYIVVKFSLFLGLVTLKYQYDKKVGHWFGISFNCNTYFHSLSYVSIQIMLNIDGILFVP